MNDEARMKKHAIKAPPLSTIDDPPSTIRETPSTTNAFPQTNRFRKMRVGQRAAE
jgi:hypothetical protein